MKKFATTVALSLALIALLPACGGTKKEKKCKPCSQTEQTTQTKKVIEYNKEDYSL